MSHTRRLLSPTALICALAVALAFAATAAAETRTGEGTAPVTAGIEPELDVIAATASYETTAGTVGFKVTTAAPPQAEKGGKANLARTEVFLTTATGPCNFSVLENSPTSSPVLGIVSEYSNLTTAEAVLLEGGAINPIGQATKSVSGATATLSFTSNTIANQGYNCAVIESQGEGTRYMVFPIGVPQAPPVVQPSTPGDSTPAPAPAPASAALSIARQKPLKLKLERWRTVRIKLSNTGGTATGPGSLRVKASKGVLVKPEKQRVPVLLPGGTWTVSLRLQLTGTPRKKSTISLTGTAPGISATSSFVIRLLAG